ncbi:aspartate/tyrosine/aromatic aminotransferase [Roseomonas nepalensis]|uniref:Aminotransferase n=1 Tax=Muricoccus nepalensis TaxID=1854500 RepID=A0A502FS82_9PROT|nr:aromatic amino acid transaminase [Roseomonas nepalensis]TPG52304.1 aspartate/tyrosine/aromatic aminotransferase [Roseomonas nepalensis]
MLERLTAMPPDALMRAARTFAADPRKEKINLGVGIYYDAAGHVPVLEAVRRAEERIGGGRSWPYLLVEGLPGLFRGALDLAFGPALAGDAGTRTAVLQTPGGTGAFRLGAEMVRSLEPRTVAAVSDPSWPNHEAVLRAVGLEVRRYAYAGEGSGGPDVEGMIRDLEALPRGSLAVLHACCHNPTGWDPTPSQWERIVVAIAHRGLVPFVDMAYQGFGDGLAADSLPVRLAVAACAPVFVALSFSKSFSLYGERVGALCVVARDGAEAALLAERGRALVRTLYSSPPTHGALLVSEVLSDPVLHRDWEDELGAMRGRIRDMRSGFTERLAAGNAPRDFSFVKEQKGLFSYSGLTARQVGRLREEHAIHAIEDGRLCLAALNPGNLDRVVDAVRGVCMR